MDNLQIMGFLENVLAIQQNVMHCLIILPKHIIKEHITVSTVRCKNSYKT